MPLMISVLSYAGSVSIMMLCDTNVVTDVDGLVEAVEHELSSNLEKASVFHSYASARMNGKRAHSTGGRGSLALRS